MPAGVLYKAPQATLDFTLDWASWLAGDTIASVVWAVPSPYTGLTILTQSNTATTTTAWFAAGIGGVRYPVTVTITTAGGRIEVSTVEVRVGTELTTREAVRKAMGVADTSKDVLIDAAIAAATGMIDEFLGCPYWQSSKTEKLSGTGTEILMLPRRPVVSVSSVVVQGSPLSASTGWGGAGWSASESFLQYLGGTWPEGVRNIEVTYVAGRSEVLPAVYQAATLIAQQIVGSQGRDGAATSYSVPGVISESFIPTMQLEVMTPTIRALLQPYRKVA